MATLATVTARVLNLLGSDDSLSTSECESLAATRYELLHDTFNWARRPRRFMLSAVAQTESSTSDTVSVTTGSATVTSAGTPFTSTMDGYQIAIDGELQPFTLAYVSTSVVTLEDGNGNAVTWAADADTAASWRVFKSLYALPADCARIDALAGQIPLEEYDGGLDALDHADPYRTATADEPTRWLYAGESDTNVKLVELWPVPTAGRILRGQYLKAAGTLTSSSYIDIPVPLLVFATAADACHLLHAKQGSSEAMWSDKALFFERKATEVSTDYYVNDQAERSLPTRLGRAASHGGGRGSGPGGDYWVSRQGPWE